MADLILTSTLALLVLGVLSYSLTRSKRERLPLPPGPPGLPVIGSAHLLPKIHPWKKFCDWHRQYGPVVYLKLAEQNTIILGDHETVHDLLDKRNSIYSSRPRLVMVAECVTKELHPVFMPFRQQWKTHHRIHLLLTNPTISKRYKGLQDLESKQLVHELLSKGDQFEHLYHRFASSVVSALAYGKRLVTGDEHELSEVIKLMEELIDATTPGTWMVDAFSWLNHIPKWLAGWKKVAEKIHDREYTLIKRNICSAMESKSWNWTKQAKQMKEAQGLSSKELGYVIASAYEAGGDTTAAALQVFTMAALLYGEEVRRAQAELDAVVGRERLPSFEDLPNLPFVTAFVNEVLRWRPILPLAIPHAVIEEDEYRGYRIPKGTTVIANVWALNFDESVFPDPYTFKPQRWVENPELPMNAFGYGRRACPGQHIARNSLVISIARILWAYDILLVYENGKPLKIDQWDMAPKIISPPAPFKANFQVRSDRHRNVIETEWAQADKNSWDI